MGKEETLAHYEREAMIARISALNDHSQKIVDLVTAQHEQIRNLNDQSRLLKEGLDMLNSQLQEIRERVKWLEENAHA